MENWIDIKNYEGLYQVSDKGRIKRLSYQRLNFLTKTISHYKERILKQWIYSTGYRGITLSKDNKHINKRVHQLVAIHFIPNTQNKPHINHKNGIKDDNNSINLEWCTPSENLKHAYKNNLRSTHLLGKTEGKHPCSKKIYQYDENDKLIKTFESISSAKRQGYNASGISAVCNKNKKLANGFYWTF